MKNKILKSFINQVTSFNMKKLSRYKAQSGIAGLWDDEESFLKAAEQAHKKKIKGVIAITPYPVHGLEEAMDIPRSWIPWVALVFGISGCLFGLWFTWWVSAVNWPVIIGGKPHWSLPAFIPVIFELTILFAALSSIGSFIYACGMPHIEPPVIDPDLTSHKFALFVPEGKEDVKSFFQELNAKEIKETEF